MFTVKTNVTKLPPLEKLIKPSTINRYFIKLKSPLVKDEKDKWGGLIWDLGYRLEIIPHFIIAVIQQESGLGTSRIAREKNNLVGWGAIDVDPYDAAWIFATKEGGVSVVCHKLRKHYIEKGRNTVESIRERYSTLDDAEKVVTIMNSIEQFRVDVEENKISP